MIDNKIKALIIDDEPHVHKLLRNVLALFPNPIDVVGDANDLPEAIRLIQEKQPSVLFLDIDMPNISGLELNKFLPENHGLIVVYVTAHSEYAIEAIRTSAFDYLLKPIALSNLKDCIERIEKEYIKRKKRNITNQQDARVEISTHLETRYITASEILYIQASAMYAIIHTSKNQWVVSKPLKSFKYLENVGFYRIHRSYLVNTKKIESLSTTYGEITLKNTEVLPVSRASKDAFKKYMRGE